MSSKPTATLAFRIVLPVLVVALAGAIVFAMKVYHKKPEEKKPEAPPPLVITMVVKKEKRPIVVHTQGTVQARQQFTLVAEVSGKVTYISPSLEPGGFFRENEILVKIDPRDYELAITRSLADRATAKSNLAVEQARADLAIREWREVGTGEPSDLVAHKPQLAQAHATVKATDAALELARRNLARCVVRAPFYGRVQEKRVEEKQVVATGVVLGSVYGIAYAEVRLPISARDAEFIQLPLEFAAGQTDALPKTVNLLANFAGQTCEWKGTIVRTESQIDARSRVLYAICRVDNPYSLVKTPDGLLQRAKPKQGEPNRLPLQVGQYVTATIVGPARSVVPVPRSAMFNRNHVLVVKKAEAELGALRTIHIRKVTILRDEREFSLVSSGLATGEYICLSPLDIVVEGMQVREAGQEKD